MGLIKIKVTNKEDGYLLYTILENKEIKIKVILLEEKKCMKEIIINKDLNSVSNWAGKWQITPEEYLNQLQECLESSSEKSIKENEFELEGQNLTWKRFIPDKNIHGRKGKFLLETIEESNVLKHVLSDLNQDLLAKDKCIANLTQKNINLLQEIKDLQSITEKSIQLKEEFEKTVYAKFALVLNANKQELKRLQLKQRDDGVSDMETVESCSTSKSTSSTLNISRKRTPPQNSDSEYDDNTDIDSPDEEVANKNSRQLLKKSRTTSEDMFNDSLEMELNNINKRT